jgi:hypothetical protein
MFTRAQKEIRVKKYINTNATEPVTITVLKRHCEAATRGSVNFCVLALAAQEQFKSQFGKFIDTVHVNTRFAHVYFSAGFRCKYGLPRAIGKRVIGWDGGKAALPPGEYTLLPPGPSGTIEYRQAKARKYAAPGYVPKPRSNPQRPHSRRVVYATLAYEANQGSDLRYVPPVV